MRVPSATLSASGPATIGRLVLVVAPLAVRASVHLVSHHSGCVAATCRCWGIRLWSVKWEPYDVALRAASVGTFLAASSAS